VGLASFGTLILSLSVAVALSRLISHGVGVRVLVPVIVSIAVADTVTALALRLRIGVILAAGVGWAISLWALALVVDPTLFDPASPVFLHAAELARQLRAAQSALADDGTPLPSLNGMVGIIGAIGGLGAALTRAIWALRWQRPDGADRGPLSPCLAPSVAIFVYSSLVSADQGRVVASVIYFLGVLAFVALADRAVPAGGGAVTTVLSALPRVRRLRPGFGALAGCALVVIVAIAAGAGLSGMRLAVFHVNPTTRTAPGRPSVPTPGPLVGRVTGIALVDHLRATEVTESDAVIFRARSAVTTYWQVGTLSRFNGRAWLPTRAVSAALRGATSATAASLATMRLPTPASQHFFTAKVVISDFASRLLPAPPATTAVHGLAGAAVLDQEGVLAPRMSGEGTTYSVRAGFDSTIPADGTQLASSDRRLAPYLALPAEPAIVTGLAHQAVGKAATQATKAQALVDWFRSGRFRYTLSPPPTHGSNPLVAFLTETKAGYCAQFAGAYGVLARLLGIPTRLAVGFTPGQAGPGDTFTVTGADSHVWPQVYLGPQTGWVSVEPTPGTPAAQGVLGASDGSRPPVARATPTTVVRHKVRRVARHAHRAHHGRRASSSGHGVQWWATAMVLVGLLVLAGAATWIVRRRRLACEGRLPPDQRVVRSWDDALRALRRRGMGRRAGETPREYAGRLRLLADDGVPPTVERSAVEDLAVLATLVELACYNPEPCTPVQVAEAQVLASTIVEANRRHHRRRRSPHGAGIWPGSVG